MVIITNVHAIIKWYNQMDYLAEVSETICFHSLLTMLKMQRALDIQSITAIVPLLTRVIIHLFFQICIGMHIPRWNGMHLCHQSYI